MNDEEFAEQLAKSHFKLNDIAIEQLKETIINFLSKNNLEVINTKNQLLAESIENVKDFWEDYLKHYAEEYIDLPKQLTEEQLQYLLERVDYLKSTYDIPDSFFDTMLTVTTEWVKENYTEYVEDE